MADKKDIEPFNFQESTNIAEHQQIVDKTNEIIEVINDVELDTVNERISALDTKVATNTTEIEANATSIANLDTKITADETQIATNKANIESNRDSLMLVSKEIEDIKEVDKDQNTQITALDNADIATATSAFDNSARKLTITLNPKSGDAITAETIIPASGETGDDYTATAPIAIANKDISLAIDTDTMEITTDGKLKSKADGKTYVAGSGISIDDTTNAISVDETVIATKATTDNLDTQIKECATGVANAITQAQTANTNALDAYNAVALSDTHLVLTKGNGNSDEIVIPSGGSDEWDELDIYNLPTDFTSNDTLKIEFNCYAYSESLNSWTTKPSAPSLSTNSQIYNTVVFKIGTYNFSGHLVSFYFNFSNCICGTTLYQTTPYDNWNKNDVSTTLFNLLAFNFNGSGIATNNYSIHRADISTYVSRMWRKKSTS